MPTFAVILPAAGKSSRFRDAYYKKPFVPLEGRPVWFHAAEKFTNRSDVKQTLLVIAPEDRETVQSKLGANAALLGIELVDGGAERYDSVAAALARVAPEIDFVAVHDAARPCLADEWIEAVFAAATRSGAAILATPISGTVKRVGRDPVTRTSRFRKPYRARGCGRRRRPRSFAANCSWTPMPAAAALRPPTTLSSSSGWVTRSPLFPARR